MDSEFDVRALKAAAKEELRGLPGMEGFGIGDQALRVYVSHADASRQLPRTFHGVDVECVVTGSITAQAKSR